MIRLGICTAIENAAVMKRIGFDYVELNMSAAAAMSGEEFGVYLEKVLRAPLPAEAMNCMLPGDFVLCSGEGTGERMRRYLSLAFARAEQLKVKVAVFGSGKARMLPEGMAPGEGLRYLTDFLRLAGAEAEKHGIAIAIEPLRAEECNQIRYVSEAQLIAREAAMPNIGALADLYHMMCGGEDCTAVRNGVIHTHIAAKEGRAFPRPGDGSAEDYRAFFEALKSFGYEGRVSIEGAAPEDFPRAAEEAFRLLRALAD